MNTALIVIDGKIKVEIPKKNKQKRVVRLNAGQHVHLPSAAFHKIRTISKTPSCFLYAYRNETDNAILETYKLYKDAGLREINKTMDGTLKSSKRNVDNPYDWNIKQSQTATSAKLWYTSVYGKLKQTNVSELLAQHSDPEFMQVLTEEHPTLIEDSILSALNTSIREISQSRTQRILQIIHNVYSFFTAKARQYRRVLFVITLTCRCLITGEALDELLLEKHDLKYT
ncbi:hypothetical protein GJ496_011729 [Pomphorhynchus laevis]|nr:hypothetical protein GJ496_011729 [Pomphorhynchus laevis]